MIPENAKEVQHKEERVEEHEEGQREDTRRKNGPGDCGLGSVVILKIM